MKPTTLYLFIGLYVGYHIGVKAQRRTQKNVLDCICCGTPVQIKGVKCGGCTDSNNNIKQTIFSKN